MMNRVRKKAFFIAVGLLTGAVLFLLHYFGAVKVDETQFHQVEQKCVSPEVEQKYVSPEVEQKYVSPLPQVEGMHGHRRLESLVISTSSVQDVSQDQGLNRVLDNIQNCLHITNMARDANETVAIANAKYFYEQYREVVPTEFLPDHASHCWKMRYDVATILPYVYRGHLGNFSLKGGLMGGERTLMNTLGALLENFKGKFSSDVVCVPNVFLAGFPKCGSSYAFCFLKSLVHLSTSLGLGAQVEVKKEPHFWVRIRVTKSIKMPQPTDLGEYLLNFLPGLHKVNALKKKDVVFIDGTPNMLFDWPRFSEKHPNSSNYCLLPSALPQLFPKSKFIIIMRNPLNVLYSAFWFSCTTKGIFVPYQTQLLGPTLFHDRIKAKIDLFNDCMRDPNEPGISEPCTVLQGSGYGPCILQRLHFLDHCVRKITFNLFSKEFPECGRSRVELGLYYTHIRKLLTVVPRDKVLVLTLEQLSKEPTVIAGQMLEFLGFSASKDILDDVKHLTQMCSENSQVSIHYKTDPKLKMKEETKAMILTFYKPFNSLLADLLQDTRFLWN